MVATSDERRCNCAEAPEAIAPLTENECGPEGSYRGAHLWPTFFSCERLAIETLLERSTSREQVVACPDCGQHWYFELAPEQYPSPDFAMKLVDAHEPDAETIRAKKAFLLVLAHGGFDARPCLKSGCSNQALRMRSLCHLHWGGMF